MDAEETENQDCLCWRVLEAIQLAELPTNQFRNLTASVSSVYMLVWKLHTHWPE
jgi:hypothetical protein